MFIYKSILLIFQNVVYEHPQFLNSSKVIETAEKQIISVGRIAKDNKLSSKILEETKRDTSR